MKRIKGNAALVATLCLVASLVFTGSAGAATTYTVEMGGEIPFGFTTRVFAPPVDGVPTIRINKGDTINLKNSPTGTIVLPVGQGPLAWFAEAADGVDAPFGYIHSDPDPDLQEPFPTDAPFKFNTSLFAPGTCGATLATACVYNGSNNDPVDGVLTSGDTFPQDGDFFVTITAEPNETLWAVSPTTVTRRSALRIQVVPGQDVTTQAEIDAAAARSKSQEADSALALHKKLRAKSTRHTDPSTGKLVHDAYVGYDTDTFALFQMYPKRLVIKKGETVRYHFSQLMVEFHGVALPAKRATRVANEGFIPVCDPDGDGGSGPDTFDVDFDTFECPPGTELEFDLSREMTAESGDGRFPGGPKRFENSGVRGNHMPTAPGFAGGWEPWDLKFTKTSSKKGYRYVCTVHGPGMSARVRVK